ncbi:phytanoyl-CoA dioxygenase family protein [Actinospica robiniae]|uniref:phytanoyl-CoA dioxygenase family protein n=1 Tax=Actinospica robiniae TaxID=304901 RepID=UPI0004148ED5|nr:phytanoyl-CoA dioxygenase family protein [Actinospica robiniae]
MNPSPSMGGAAPLNRLTDRERFLFDLNGFVVVRGALTESHVARLNEAVDRHPEGIARSTLGPGPSKTLGGSRRCRGFKPDPLQLPEPDARPFRELVRNPESRRYLDSLLGRGWRLDSAPEIILADQGADGMCLHGSGQRWFSPVTYYSYANDVIRCGMITLEFALTAARAGDGGFACIPGSPKANLHCPASILKWEQDTELVRQIEMEPGDLIVFTEALLHGTLPWRAAHQRRVILMRQVPKVNCTVPPRLAYHQTSYPDWINDLAPEDRVPFEAPYFLERPVLTEDDTVEPATEWV